MKRIMTGMMVFLIAMSFGVGVGFAGNGKGGGGNGSGDRDRKRDGSCSSYTTDGVPQAYQVLAKDQTRDRKKDGSCSSYTTDGVPRAYQVLAKDKTRIGRRTDHVLPTPRTEFRRLIRYWLRTRPVIGKRTVAAKVRKRIKGNVQKGNPHDGGFPFLFRVDVPAFSGVGPNQVIDATDQSFIFDLLGFRPLGPLFREFLLKFAGDRRRWIA